MVMYWYDVSNIHTSDGDVMKYITTCWICFMCGILAGHGIEKPPVKIISSPVEMIVEEDCFMDNEGERLRMKRLTIEDLNAQDN